MSTVGIQLALAVLLFYILNWIGEHASTYGYVSLSLFVHEGTAPAFNFVLKSLTPSVYIILLSTAAFALGLDEFTRRIWLVAAYYFAFRVIYNVVMGRALLLNWVSIVSQTLVGTFAAFLVYRYIIVPRKPLYPDAEKLAGELWVIIALFLYAILNNVRTSQAGSAARKNRYIRARFTEARARYGPIIDGQFSERYVELIAYAILIYESFNRPKVAQWMERALFPWGSHTLGPMQVSVDHQVSDSESVRIGVQRLKEAFESTKQECQAGRATRYDLIRRSVAKYNRDERYIAGVTELLHILWAQIAPEYRTEFESMYAYT